MSSQSTQLVKFGAIIVVILLAVSDVSSHGCAGEQERATTSPSRVERVGGSGIVQAAAIAGNVHTGSINDRAASLFMLNRRWFGFCRSLPEPIAPDDHLKTTAQPCRRRMDETRFSMAQASAG